MTGLAITSVIGANASGGSQLTVSGTWNGLTHIVLSVKCVDSSGTPQSFIYPPSSGPPIPLNANGTFSATVASPCACGGQYTIVADGYVADNAAEQVVVTGQLECPVTCCPDPADFDILAAAGPCDSSCKRSVTVTIVYQGAAKPGCPANGVVSVSIRDSLGATVHAWPAFPYTLAGTFQQSFPAVQLTPAAGYEVVVQTFVGGDSCQEIKRKFELLDCQGPPPCPTGLTLSALDAGCAFANGACRSSAQFVIGGTFGIGCGSSAATQLLLDYGDGNSETIAVPGGGFQQIVRNHSYGSGGTKTAQVVIVNPAGCSPSAVAASVNLKQCAPEDCVTCPEPPTAPSWCLCKSCWLFSRKPGKGFCKLLMLLMFVIISSATLGILQGWTTISLALSWQNIAAVSATLGTAFFLIFYAKWCSNCCAACAIWPGIVIGIIASLILWYYGYGPTGGAIQWVITLVIVLLAALALYLHYNSECANEKADELSDENWCKPA